jgi:hypothetical protein
MSEGITMRLSIVLAGLVSFGLAHSALADYKTGLDAYQKGDFKTALAEVKPSAEQGNAMAQFGMGLMYRNGQGVLPDYQEAHKWFSLAAEQGNGAAQFNLAMLYHNGQGVPKNYQEAARIYRLAAENGNARAQYNLGTMYQMGQGVPQDYKEAARLIRQAADQKMAVAQFSLGGLYFAGHGVAQDYNEAVRWYRLAADQRTPIALIALSGMYANGQGVVKSPVAAYALANVVAAKNKTYAGLRDKLGTQLSAAQLKDAQKLTADIAQGTTRVFDRNLAAK